MSLTRNEINELNGLSKDVFGTASRWQKLVTKGYVQLLTEKKTEIIPGTEEIPESTQEVDVPVLRADGAAQSVLKRHTPESVKELMVKMRDQRDAMLEAMRAQQEAKKAKEEQELLQKKIQEDVGGSAT